MVKIMRVKDIEKLRAFALLMVLFGHMPIAVPDLLIHGYTGVTLFFIISGYVCCLSFEKSMGRFEMHKQFNSCIEFYLSRFFRVVPVIVIWLLVYSFIGQLTNYLGGTYGDTVRFFKEIGWWNTGLYNYYFAYSRMGGMFGHLWSMAIELQFYLMLPIFYCILSSPRKRVFGSIFMIVVSLIFLAITPDEYAGKLTHTQMGSIFLGVLLYNIRGRLHFVISIPCKWKKMITTFLLIAIFVLPAYLDGRALPIIGGALVYLAQLDSGWYIDGKIVTKYLLKIAKVLFSTYVSHVLLYSCIYYNLYTYIILPLYPWLATEIGVAVQIIILLFLPLCIGELSNQLIEKPFMLYSKKIIADYKDSREKIQFMKC